MPHPPDKPEVVYQSKQVFLPNDNKIDLLSGNGVEDKSKDVKIEPNNLKVVKEEDERFVSEDEDLWEDIEDEDENNVDVNVIGE